MKPEVREGLQSVIMWLLKHGLLVPCHSPCIIPILAVKNSNGKHRLVKHLRAINEVMVPIGLTVSNAKVILGEIPPETKCFSVWDFKDAFFCIHLDLESQYLSGQMTKE